VVIDRVKEIISEQTGRDAKEIMPETNFRKGLNMDSIDLFQIINDLEDEFNVNIDDMEKIITVGDAVRYIENA
jgi:acyl carrier protein